MTKQLRDTKGKYAKRAWKMKTFVIGMAIMGGYFLAMQTNTIRAEAPVPQIIEKLVDISDKQYEEKIDSLKQEVLDTLSLKCEVKGLEDPDGALVFDSNNEASIGRFQFQRSTVIHYYKALYGKDITKSEAIAIAIDPVRATQLAKDIIFTTEAGVDSDWVNCSKWHNLQREVDIIKKLEQ